METNGEKELVSWFRNDILPEILREGHFPTGKNPIIVNCEFQMTKRFTDHFASSPYFFQMIVDSDDGRKILDLIVKFPSQNDIIMNLLYLERQFQNETTVYGKLLKELQNLLVKNPKAPIDMIDQIIPKCYYSRFDEKNPKKSLLIFADERKNGYKNAESKILLDYEHCAISMKQLGRFHALSLAMKINFPESLNAIKELLTECRYMDDPLVREKTKIFNGLTSQRGIDHLLSLDSSPVPKDYLIRMKEMLNQPYELFVHLITPKEPLALICHGDYCRNNLLFRYDGDRVINAKMFDFQLTRYANPSIDLSFLIYLNTSQKIRDQHFDDLLKIYHSSLISAISEILDIPEIEIENRYPFKLITDDFAEHAIYGYCLASFFIPGMLCSGNIDWNETTENQARYLYEVGGEEISQKIADILLDFHKRGFYVS